MTYDAGAAPLWTFGQKLKREFNMKAPKLIRGCPLRSSELAGDVREFYCTVCKKNITNLSLIDQREAQGRIRESRLVESCGMWLEDRDGNLVQGPRALEILKRMVAAGALAASIQAGSQLHAEDQKKGEHSKADGNCENVEQKNPSNTKSEEEEQIVLTVGFFVDTSEMAYSMVDGKMVWLPKKPKPMRFHKKR